MTNDDHHNGYDETTSGKSDSGTREAPDSNTSQNKAARGLPPWKVILHNDGGNESVEMVKAVRRLTPLSSEQATKCTEEVKSSGKSILLITHQERAELYVDQFASCKLTVSIEPDA